MATSLGWYNDIIVNGEHYYQDTNGNVRHHPSGTYVGKIQGGQLYVNGQPSGISLDAGGNVTMNGQSIGSWQTSSGQNPYAPTTSAMGGTVPSGGVPVASPSPPAVSPTPAPSGGGGVAPTTSAYTLGQNMLSYLDQYAGVLGMVPGLLRDTLVNYQQGLNNPVMNQMLGANAGALENYRNMFADPAAWAAGQVDPVRAEISGLFEAPSNWMTELQAELSSPDWFNAERYRDILQGRANDAHRRNVEGIISGLAANGVLDSSVASRALSQSSEAFGGTLADIEADILSRELAERNTAAQLRAQNAASMGNLSTARSGILGNLANTQAGLTQLGAASGLETADQTTQNIQQYLNTLAAYPNMVANMVGALTQANPMYPFYQASGATQNFSNVLMPDQATTPVVPPWQQWGYSNPQAVQWTPQDWQRLGQNVASFFGQNNWPYASYGDLGNWLGQNVGTVAGAGGNYIFPDLNATWSNLNLDQGNLGQLSYGGKTLDLDRYWNEGVYW